MNNVRFATSIHIMVLLALNKDELLSSDYIAGSININPVLVRKEIMNLRANGLVISKEGKGGGSILGKTAESILLSDIYHIVKQSSILGRFNNTNPKCPVGKQINRHIDALYNDAEKALICKLETQSLADFCRQFD